MAHKVLITFAVNVASHFKMLIGPTDAVRGEPVELSFAITNIGTDLFPGGKVKSLRIDYGIPPGAFSIFSQEWDCPPLTPNVPQELLKAQVVPIVEGLAWIKLVIEARDNQPIQYYQHPDEPLNTPSNWLSCFYIVNREILLLLSRFGHS